MRFKVALALTVAPCLALAQTNQAKRLITGPDAATAILQSGVKLPGVDTAAAAAANTAAGQAAQAQASIAMLAPTVTSMQTTITSLQAQLVKSGLTITSAINQISALRARLGNISALNLNTSTNVLSVTGGGQTDTITLGGAVSSSNAPPSITGMGPLAGTDSNTVAPFAAVAVTDADASPSVSTTITTGDASDTPTDANGVLSGTGLTKTGTGTYTLAAAAPSALTAVLQALIFTPTPQQVAAGLTVATQFDVTAVEGIGTTTASEVLTITGTSTGPGASGTVTGTVTNLTPDGTPVVTIAGSRFSWVNQAGGSVAAGTPVALSQPAHPNSTNQSAIWSRMNMGAACYAGVLQNPNSRSLYNSGMFVTNASQNRITVVQNVFANNSQSNVVVATESDFSGTGQNSVFQSSFPALISGSLVVYRICSDGTNLSFSVSPTGADSSFTVMYSASIVSLGNPSRVGFFVDANPTGGDTFAGSLNIYNFQATATNTPQAAAVGGDPGMSFLVYAAPNAGFPVSNATPKITGDVPKYSLALAGGSTNVVDMTFPGSGESTITIPNDAALRKYIYLNYDEGAPNVLGHLVGWPQDDGQGPSAPFWGHARTYALGDGSNLIPVTTDGLKMKAHCAGPSNALYSICGPDQVRSGFMRLPTRFVPGMTMEITYRPPSSYNGWVPWWLYTGEQLTPYPNSDTTATGLSYQSSSPNFEIDLNDGFARNDYGGCPYGGQIDFGTPAGYGTTWATAPYMAYAAGSGGFTWNTSGYNTLSTSNNYICETAFAPGAIRTLLVNWRNDGTHLIDIFDNGKRVGSAYMEYPQTQTFNGHQLGMQMLIGGQNVPTFNNPGLIVDNDAVTSSNGDAGWTETIYSIKAWTGNLASPTANDAGTNAAH